MALVSVRSVICLATSLSLAIAEVGILVHPLRSQPASNASPASAPATSSQSGVTIRSLPPACGLIELRTGSAGVTFEASQFPISEAVRPFLFTGQYQQALDLLKNLPPDYQPVAIDGLLLLMEAVARSGTAAERVAVRDYAVQFVKASDEPPVIQASNLRNMAAIYLKANSVEDAIVLSKAAMQLINTVPDSDNLKGAELERLIESFTQPGLDAAALQVADVSQDVNFKVSVRFDLAEQYQKRGKLEQADALHKQVLTLVQTLTPVELQADWLLELAQQLQGQPEQVKQLVTSAASIVSAIPEGIYKADMLLQLAGQQQKLGQEQEANRNRQQAVTIAQTLAKEPNSEFSLSYLGRVALEAQQLEAADQLFTLALKATRNSDRLLEEITRDYAATGNFEQALQWMAKIKATNSKESARVNITLNALDLERFDIASNLIQGSSDPFIQQMATAGLIARYLETGKEKEALQLARQPKHFDSLLVVAERFSKTNQRDRIGWVLEQATQLAKGLSSPSAKQQALLAVVSKAAYLHQFDQVLKLSATLDESQQKQLKTDIIQNVLPAITQDESQVLRFATALPNSSLKLQVLLQSVSHYVRMGQKASALTLLEQAIPSALLPGNRNQLESIARTYWIVGEPGKALQLVEMYNLQFGADRDGGLQRIEITIQAGKPEQARQQLASLLQKIEGLAIKPPKAGEFDEQAAEKVKLLAQVATQYANLGDRAQAMSLLTRATELQNSATLKYQPSKYRDHTLSAIVASYARLIARSAEAGQSTQAKLALKQGQAISGSISSDTAKSVPSSLLQCVQTHYSL